MVKLLSTPRSSWLTIAHLLPKNHKAHLVDRNLSAAIGGVVMLKVLMDRVLGGAFLLLSLLLCLLLQYCCCCCCCCCCCSCSCFSLVFFLSLLLLLLLLLLCICQDISILKTAACKGTEVASAAMLVWTAPSCTVSQSFCPCTSECPGSWPWDKPTIRISNFQAFHASPALPCMHWDSGCESWNQNKLNISSKSRFPWVSGP